MWTVVDGDVVFRCDLIVFIYYYFLSQYLFTYLLCVQLLPSAPAAVASCFGLWFDGYSLQF